MRFSIEQSENSSANLELLNLGFRRQIEHLAIG